MDIFMYRFFCPFSLASQYQINRKIYIQYKRAKKRKTNLLCNIMVHEKWQKMIAEHYEVTTDMAWYLQQHEPIMRDLNK